MKNSLNRCEFIGNLGADPETRYMASGDAVTSFSIACNWKGKDKEGTEWIRLTCFGKKAEIIGQYMRKGSKIYVAGQQRTRKWQGQDGQDRYTTEVVVNEFQFLDSRTESAGGGGNARPSANPDGGQGAGVPPQTSGGGMGDFEDDVPFGAIGREHQS